MAGFEDRGEPIQARKDARQGGGQLTLASPEVGWTKLNVLFLTGLYRVWYPPASLTGIYRLRGPVDKSRYEMRLGLMQQVRFYAMVPSISRVPSGENVFGSRLYSKLLAGSCRLAVPSLWGLVGSK